MIFRRRRMTEQQHVEQAAEVLVSHAPENASISRIINRDVGVCIVIARTKEEAELLSAYYEERKRK